MKGNNIYMAVLAASMFGVSIPVFADTTSSNTNTEITVVDDSALVSKVKSALAADAEIAALAVNVSVKSGVVVLSGLASEKDKLRAQEIVLAIAGVKDVKNEIQVQ